MDEKKPPLSVTVIGWFLMVTATLGLVVTPCTLRMPEFQRIYEAAGVSDAAALLWTLLGHAVTLISGIAIFKGHNWGRVLYIFFTPVSMVGSGFIFGFGLFYVLSVIVYMVFLLLLTRSAPAAFFKRAPAAEARLEEQKGMLRKIGGVVLLIIGGSFIICLFLPSIFVFQFEEVVAGGLVLLVFAGLATPLMAGGIGLWGWRRWRIVLGVVVTVVGAVVVLCAMSIPLVMHSREWEWLGGPEISHLVKPTLKVSALFGALLLALGILLILRQKNRDKSVKA